MKKKLVTKSHRMMRARDGLLTHQHKFLGLAVSKLDPFKDVFDKVEITYSDYCHLSGERIENKHYKRFYETGRKALKRWIYIENEDGSEWKEWPLVTLIEGKKGTISIDFNQGLKEHFILIKERFSQIGLDTYFQFRRDYTAGFYELLKTAEKHADGNSEKKFFIDITIEDIRKKFQLGEKYKFYKHLKSRVILDALNEISEKTELKFVSLEETGRPVHKVRIWAIKGEIRPSVKALPDAEQLSLVPEPTALDKARQEWPHERIEEEIKKRGDFASPEMYMTTKGLEVRQINGKYEVVGLIDLDEPAAAPIQPEINLSEKQEKVRKAAITQGIATIKDMQDLKTNPRSVIGRWIEKLKNKAMG